MTEDKNTQVHEEPQVMSETDVHDFQGLTLNENGQEERSREQMDWDDAAKQAGIHVIHIHSLSLWKKILYGAAFIGFLMLLAVVVWFAFVGFGAILAVAALVYVVSRLLR